MAAAKTNKLVVLQAVVITAAITVALTCWAMQSKRNFTDYMGYALVVGIALLVASIFGLFFGSPLMSCIISAAMACLVGFYLLVDIQMLFGKNGAGAQLDDYILMSLNLYIDIVMLFKNILNILVYANDE